MEKALKGLQAELKEQIKDSNEAGEQEHDCDWGHEQGVLISRHQAAIFLDLVNRTLEVKEDDNKLLNQTILLNWIRQWTDLYNKGQEGTFKALLQDFIFDYMTDLKD